jgi:hypothetical protein
MKMPNIQEIKDKVSNVKVPQKLKEDLSFAGNTALFLASPPVYAAKKGFTSQPNENWYEKSRRATFNFIGTGILCILGSGITDDMFTRFGRDRTVENSEIRVTYEFGSLLFSQRWNWEVKDDSLMRKALLPFERILNQKNTYGKSNQRTEFEGKIKRNGLDFIVEGYMPVTTNVTDISTADLSKYTYKMYLGRPTQNNIDLLYGLDKK